MEHTENGSTAKPEDSFEGYCFTNVKDEALQLTLNTPLRILQIFNDGNTIHYEY
jgi:hypothetical protein